MSTPITHAHVPAPAQQLADTQAEIEAFAQTWWPARPIWNDFVEAVPNLGIRPDVHSWAYFVRTYAEAGIKAGVLKKTKSGRWLADKNRFGQFALRAITEGGAA